MAPAENRQSPADYRALFNSYGFELDPEVKLVSPILRQALAVWEAARGDRPMPSRADIDVLAIPKPVLSHILMTDIEPGPPQRFRWRLIGTHITSLLGRDSTGKYYDELYSPEAMGAMLMAPRWVMAHKRPVRTLGHAAYVNKRHLRSENLEMPLSDDGKTVSMMFVASEFRLEDDPV